MPKANPIVLEKKDELWKALRDAQVTGYAAGNTSDHGDGTHECYHQAGDWEVLDNWSGGPTARDDTDVFYDGVLCWSVGGHDLGVVYGPGTKEVQKAHREEVIAFLKKALLAANPDFPIRGPVYYCADGYIYTCESVLDGPFDIGKFELIERITTDTELNLVYKGRWIGGWTNVDPE